MAFFYLSDDTTEHFSVIESVLTALKHKGTEAIAVALVTALQDLLGGYGARSGRCFRCVPRLAQGPADRRDYRRRRGDRAAAPDGYALGRVSVICKTAVLSGDRAFKPLNNRFDLQRVPLVYRQYRS